MSEVLVFNPASQLTPDQLTVFGHITTEADPTKHMIDVADREEFQAMLPAIFETADTQNLVKQVGSRKVCALINGQENTGLAMQRHWVANRKLLTLVTYYQDLSTEDGRLVQFSGANESFAYLQHFTRRRPRHESHYFPLMYFSRYIPINNASPEQKSRLRSYLREPLLPVWINQVR